MASMILQTLMQVHEDLLEKLHNFIEIYHESTEEYRMTTFTGLSGQFNKVLEFEWNSVFPMLDTMEQLATLRTGAVQKRNSLAECYERLIMIHVNEPGDLFHKRLAEVYHLFMEYHQAMKTMIGAPSLQFDESRLKVLEEKFNKLFYATSM